MHLYYCLEDCSIVDVIIIIITSRLESIQLKNSYI